MRSLFTRKATLFILCLMLISTTISSAPLLQVTIKQKNVTLNYEQAPRLSQVLTDAYQQLTYSPYSLGTSLIDLNPSSISHVDTKKRQLLETLQDSSDPSALNLYQILNSLTLVNRILLNLDLEAIQLNAKLNPLLKGKYSLSLPKRPNHILMIDPLSHQSVIKLALKPGQAFKHYLDDYLISLKSNDTHNIEQIKQANDYKKFHIIQADKKSIVPITGYWSNNQYYLSPGAIIFVNLNTSTQEAEQINQQFIELLKYYVAY